MSKKISEELNYMKYLLGYKKGIVISEQRSLLREGDQPYPCEKNSKNTAGFQEKAHMALYAGGQLKLSDQPQGCNTSILSTGLYSPGVKNQCKWTAHPLCGGKDCFQKQAIDGIWGTNTENVWKTAQDMLINNKKIYDIVKANCKDLEADDATTQNWQIPANTDNIKLFQWWIWQVIEANNKQNPANDIEFQSALCGGKFCNVEMAMDGIWGTNTKNLWKTYGQCYQKYYRTGDVYNDANKNYIYTHAEDGTFNCG